MALHAPLTNRADVEGDVSQPEPEVIRRSRVRIRSRHHPSLFTSSGGFRALIALALTGAIWVLVIGVVSG